MHKGDSMGQEVSSEQPEQIFQRGRDYRKIYATGAVGGWNKYDFRLGLFNDKGLGSSEGEADKKDVVLTVIEADIVLTPLAMKELTKFLVKQLEAYEKENGPIEAPKLPKPLGDVPKKASLKLQ